SRRIQTDRASDGRDPDRERCRGWSYSDRDSGPGLGAHGGARPRDCRARETALDTVRWRVGSKRAAHSCAAPARSHVRSAPERSALPKTRGIARAEIGAMGWLSVIGYQLSDFAGAGRSQNIVNTFGSEHR